MNDQPGTRPARFRSRLIFSVFMGIIAVFLVWPGYPLFSSATPLVFGFPLSFAWIILCTLAGFAAMLALYRSDRKHEEEE